MSRCLCVTFGVPRPSGSGNRMRTFYLLRALAASHKVSLLILCEFPEEQAQIGQVAAFCQRVVTVPRAARRAGVRRTVVALQHSLAGWALAADQYYSAQLVQELHNLLGQENFDFLQIEHLQLAPLLRTISPTAARVKLLDLHNVSFAQ